MCRDQDVEILKGHVAKDHVHVFVSVPPQVTVSRLVQRVKGKTSYRLMAEYGHLRRQFWVGISGRVATFACPAAM